MNRKRLQEIGLVLLVAVIYFGASRLGLSLAVLQKNVSPVWPPTGVAIALIFLLGYRMSAGVLLGAFLANFVLTDLTLLPAAGIAIGNTLEAVTAVYLLRRFVGGRNPFNRAVDFLKFVFLGALVSTTVSATLGNVVLCLSGAASWGGFTWLWLTWWFGDAAGALVVVPLIITWAEPSSGKQSAFRFAEGALLLVAVAFVSATIYTNLVLRSETARPWGHITIPLLVWAAFRFGPRGVSSAIAILSAIAIWGTINGYGAFAAFAPNEGLLFLQAYLANLTITTLCLAAIVTERKRADRDLTGNLTVTRILAEAPLLADALPRIIARICQMFQWQLGAMWALDSDSETLTCLRVWPELKGNSEKFCEVTYAHKFAKGVGLPGRVWSSLRPAWIPDVTTDKNFPRAEPAAAAGLHAAFAFPILSGEKFLGVMEFFSNEIREPDDGLLATFSGIGGQIGQFIERKSVEEEREALLIGAQAARNDAEQANRMKDEFLATLSHELRTPLTAMMGWLSMLRSGRLDVETTTQAIETVDRNAKVQAQLIEDLVDVSRIVGGKLKMEVRTLDLRPVIDAAVDVVRPAASARGVAIEVKAEESVGLVTGDAARLQQVIWNLLSNAVKFTPRDGSTHVVLSRNGSWVEVVVRDTGAGIRPEFLPYVFERFSQAESPLTRSHRGLGLGLAIVRHLTELHGGTVRAESDGEGKGATFTISLPLAITQNLAADEDGFHVIRPVTTPAWQQTLTGVRVLVVEDEDDARELLSLALTQSGAEVQVATSAKDGLQSFSSFKPDVLLSDIGLPGESGYDLIRKVRARADLQNIPAVALTAFATDKDRDLALAAGFQAHLAKPIEPDALVELIEQLVNRRDGVNKS